MSILTRPKPVIAIESIDEISPVLQQNNKTNKTKNYEIRKAATKQELERVYRLTHDAYVEMNYAKPQPDSRLIHYPELENIPETTVMIAESGSRVLGTLSITVDGPAGLNTDRDFPEHTSRIRSQTKMLAACWRMVTCKDYRHKKSIVKDLFKESLKFIFRQLEIDTLLCTVNPCHERVYQLLFGCETVARQVKSIDGLENAPAILMRLENKNVPERWFS
ncbi:hypothetical protein GF407_01590 [candidate division KSB1 bacterium]|nr:hypothetical protein [candidate division KSB1 bacterium]